MKKEELLKIINKYVGYAEPDIYDAVNEFEEEIKKSLIEKEKNLLIKIAENYDDMKHELNSELGTLEHSDYNYKCLMDLIKIL